MGSTAIAPGARGNKGTAEKINVLGVGISVLNLDSATRAVLDAAGGDGESRGYICVTGVHGVTEAQDDPSFREILNRAFLCTPDGMPMVWIGRFVCGKEHMGRVYGPDLLWEVFRNSEKTPLRHFFYGGKEGVAGRLKENLLQHFPGATVVGTFSPPFRDLAPQEVADLKRQVEEAKPDILWVGLSTPKQEKFMAKNQGILPVKLMIGVGAAFDFHAGLVPSAPAWMQRSGLEWLYRLSREPARLWPRYSRIVPRFLLLFSAQLLGRAPRPLDTTSAPAEKRDIP